MIPLIGLHGPIGSGKDTLAALLNANGFRSLKFAGPLYAAANAIDPKFHPQMPHKDKQASLLGNALFGSRRNFLEKLGTEFLRNTIHEDFFCLYMKATVLDSIASAPNVPIVISDVRFENEAELIRKLGGHIVHLRPDWNTEVSNHASASGLKYDTGDSILGLEYGRPDKGYKQLLAIIEEIYAHSSSLVG